MSTETTQFELVSPEKLLYSAPVEMVVVPGGEGDFGVLPRHSPMISTVRPGVIDVYQDGKVSERIFVAGGFAEVSETRVTVLADEAVPHAELDAEAIGERVKDAEMRLKVAAEGSVDHLAAVRALLVANAMQDALSTKHR
jgi:F-type H+-transporting ATPase subunit epsilon